MAKEDNKKDDVKKDDRLKALDAALSQIEKQYGKGSVMKLGDTSHMQVDPAPFLRRVPALARSPDFGTFCP